MDAMDDPREVVARKFGKVDRDVFRRDPLARRVRLLETFGITVVLDVGANVGQYALRLREAGYEGRIVSFEPVTMAFDALRARAAHDDRWTAVMAALGDHQSSSVIHVADNSVSSSFLPMLPAHVEVAPESRYCAQETVEVVTLDAVFGNHVSEAERAFLKVDVQGFERRVLAGARASLDSIVGMQLEMSIVPLYDGEMDYMEALAMLRSAGFLLMSVEPGFDDLRTGQLLQFDGVFFRAPDGWDSTHRIERSW